MWLLLILCASTALAQPNCGRSGTQFTWWETVSMWYIRYDSTPCNGLTPSRTFCEDSGWGVEEATVVCREQGYGFGSGRYILVDPYNDGYGHIECDGSEESLADCVIGPVSSEECEYVGVVNRCSYAPQVYVTGLVHNQLFPHHLIVGEEEGGVRVCLEVVGADSLTDTVHIHLTTTDITGGIYQSATSGIDYVSLSQTLTLGPSVTSEHCVEIEILDDSLTESWEMFEVQLSTNSTAVYLVNWLVHIYISPNDMPSPISNSSQGNSISSTQPPKSVPTSTQDTTYYTSTSTSISGSVVPATSTFTASVSSIGSPASSTLPTTDSSRKSNALVVGVTVTVVLVFLTLTLSLLAVTLTLWLRRKTKKLNKSEPPQSSPDETQNEDENKRLSITNPTYEPTAHQLGTTDRSRTPEHNLVNPLYSAQEHNLVNPLYSAPEHTLVNPLYSAPEHTLVNPLYSAVAGASNGPTPAANTEY